MRMHVPFRIGQSVPYFDNLQIDMCTVLKHISNAHVLATALQIYTINTTTPVHTTMGMLRDMYWE